MRRVSMARVGTDAMRLARELIDAFPEMYDDISYVVSKRCQRLREWEGIVVTRSKIKYERLKRETVDDVLAARFPWIEHHMRVYFPRDVEWAGKTATDIIDCCVASVVRLTRGDWEPYDASISCRIGCISGYTATIRFERFDHRARPEVMVWPMHHCRLHRDKALNCDNAYLQEKWNEQKELEYEMCRQLFNCYPID